ncbi:MAG: transcriptional repressor [Sphaerochaetaceae bacterium]|nr:transcriptional repressor [Sphaerochaetaceae bacterium]
MKTRKYEKAILEIINNSYDHLSAEEVFAKLKESEPKVVLASVYNNLNALVAEDKIRRVAVEGQKDRYDRMTRHDHLVCKCCGAITDFHFDDLTRAIEEKLGEKILGYNLNVIYMCPSCKAKNTL